MTFYAPFTLPFIIGALAMFLILGIKWGIWTSRLTKPQKRLLLRNLPTRRFLAALWESVREALLHRRIWRVNPLLGYMHTSLAFGWFLLIAVGWIETLVVIGPRFVPLQGHVFFKYFATELPHNPFFEQTMDLLLLFVLSGVALAWIKRMRARTMGMRRTTRHVAGDRFALTALWCVFPLRLAAESLVCALHGGGGFLTGSLGRLLAAHLSPETLAPLNEAAWWCYSTALGVFFVALPFSRYMHIFTEIPLIFLRRCGIRSSEKKGFFDHFQIEACSRCGICIDPCQLQRTLGADDVQSVYFLRDRRYRTLRRRVTDHCLMCGRCAERCPVGIDLNTLRLNARTSLRNIPTDRRYDYLQGIDRSAGAGRVGYFAGCMTLQTPRTLRAMERIFRAAGEEVWWADRDGGVCCGRPLKLSGEVDAARKMMAYNTELFRRHGIATLVTSCPICLKVFREDYRLEGIEVLHHSEYLLRLLQAGRLALQRGERLFTYHDPCELGRGSGIYDEPRAVIEAIGTLTEPAETREEALCCGSSVADLEITDGEQLAIARDVAASLERTGAETIVTACPLCKKAIGRGTERPVADLAEVVAEALTQTA